MKSLCFALVLAVSAVVTMAAAEPGPVARKGAEAVNDGVGADAADKRFEFQEGVRNGTIPMAKAIGRMREIRIQPGEIQTEEFGPYIERQGLFLAGCARANTAELKQLAEILAKFETGSAGFPECFSAFATARFRRIVEDFHKKPRRLQLAPTTENVPETLRSAPRELQDAWSAWQTAMGPYRRLEGTVAAKLNEGAKDAEADERKDATDDLPDDPEALLRNLLTGRRPQMSEALMACAIADETPAEASEWKHPLTCGILLALLDEGRIDAAVGAALIQSQMDITYDTFVPASFNAVLATFLTDLGLDWELIQVGGLLPEKPGKIFDSESLLSNIAEPGPWKTLAAIGSAKDMRLGILMLRHYKVPPKAAFVFLGGALEPDQISSDNPISHFIGKFRPRRTLPAKTIAELQSSLGSYFSADRTVTELDAALKELPPYLVKHVRGPLKSLVEHRTYAIASQALKMVTPPPPPVRFRVMLNGKALAETKVSVSGDGYKTKDFETDLDGRFYVSFDDVLVPEEVRELAIRCGPFECKVSDLLDVRRNVKLGAMPGVWPGPWFEIKAPVKLGIPWKEENEEIHADTGDMEIGFEGIKGVAQDTPIKVSVTRGDVVNGVHDSHLGWAVLTGKTGGTVIFHGLQVG